MSVSSNANIGLDMVVARTVLKLLKIDDCPPPHTHTHHGSDCYGVTFPFTHFRLHPSTRKTLPPFFKLFVLYVFPFVFCFVFCNQNQILKKHGEYWYFSTLDLKYFQNFKSPPPNSY